MSLSALIFLTLSWARADVVVRDPRNFLADLQGFIGVNEWSQAFKCGDRRTFLRNTISCDNKCTASSCVIKCQEAGPVDRQFDLALEECTADGVAIYGTNGFAASLSRKDFEATGSWVLPLIQNLGHFLQPIGEVEISFGMTRLFTIIENGQSRQEFGYMIDLDVSSFPGAQKQIYQIGFLRGRDLLDSLVWFGSLERETFLKRRGVSLAF